MSKRTIGFAASCLVAGGLAVTGASALAGEEATGAAGMKVFIDPATGNVVNAPATQAPAGALSISPAEQRAFSKSSDGLVATPSAGPHGGTKVDLRGRFRSPLIATVGPDGKVEMRHGAEPAHQNHD